MNVIHRKYCAILPKPLGREAKLGGRESKLGGRESKLGVGFSELGVGFGELGVGDLKHHGGIAQYFLRITNTPPWCFKKPTAFLKKPPPFLKEPTPFLKKPTPNSSCFMLLAVAGRRALPMG